MKGGMVFRSIFHLRDVQMDTLLWLDNCTHVLGSLHIALLSKAGMLGWTPVSTETQVVNRVEAGDGRYHGQNKYQERLTSCR